MRTLGFCFLTGVFLFINEVNFGSYCNSVRFQIIVVVCARLIWGDLPDDPAGPEFFHRADRTIKELSGHLAELRHRNPNLTISLCIYAYVILPGHAAPAVGCSVFGKEGAAGPRSGKVEDRKQVIRMLQACDLVASNTFETGANPRNRKTFATCKKC